MTSKYIPFYGGPFSQWSPCDITIDGVHYNCAEQYMMAKKALVFQDLEAHAAIMASEDPSEQKAIGRKVKGFNAAVWDTISRDVVARASVAKFTSSRRYFQELSLTQGTVLVEASPTDRLWGIGLYEGDPKVHDPAKWRGSNWLGQVLNETRDALLAGSTLFIKGRAK